MEAKILSNQIEGAQKKVEEQNFVARKNVLKYDDVMNVQRQKIYEQRRRVLEGHDLNEDLREEWLPEVISNVVAEYTPGEINEEWDLDELVTAMGQLYGTGVAAEELRSLDLEDMDYMREGIHLRGMAQKDPLVEYRNEGAMMFVELNAAIREEVVTLLFHAEIEPQDAPALDPQQDGRANGNLTYEHQSLAGADAIAAAGGTSATATAAIAGGGSVATAPRPVVKSEQENIGRNDPCWCGSGKKFKRCHGA